MATKFILIEQLDEVGMHHWCKRSLHKGEVLTSVREPDNPVDKNAVTLYNQNGSEKMAYLGWSDAKRMKMLMEHPNVLNRYNLMAIVTGKWAGIKVLDKLVMLLCKSLSVIARKC